MEVNQSDAGAPFASAGETEPRPAESVNEPARIVTRLAELPGKALLDEQAMADAFGVSKRTVRRMVSRFEIPPPVSLAGKATWVAERVLAHIEGHAERAARKAEQEARRIEALPYRTGRAENSSVS
jgi:predicted DNA-binding transcriptional regulator AlpA